MRSSEHERDGGGWRRFSVAQMECASNAHCTAENPVDDAAIDAVECKVDMPCASSILGDSRGALVTKPAYNAAYCKLPQIQTHQTMFYVHKVHFLHNWSGGYGSE
eukprot:2559807-Amphidinium_carterae.2